MVVGVGEMDPGFLLAGLADAGLELGFLLPMGELAGGGGEELDVTGFGGVTDGGAGVVVVVGELGPLSEEGGGLGKGVDAELFGEES